MSTLLDNLRNQADILTSEFEASKIVWHNASVGTIREEIVKKIIQPYLPDCYGISGGLCFDANDSKSKQLDLILYDKLYSYRLPINDNFMIFPAESVYGNIEIKTKLNSKTVKESIDNIVSLKKLKRNDATEFDVTPFLRLTINGQKMGTKKNNYIGVVFAYESLTASKILEHIKEHSTGIESTYLPDVFVLFNQGIIIYKGDKLPDNNYNISLGGTNSGYIAIKTGKDTIMYFILTLLFVLYDSHLQSVNPGSLFMNEIKKIKIDSKDFVLL